MDLSSDKIKSNYKLKQTQDKKNVALLRRKYTTRQVMELMELRRRQKGLPAEPDRTQAERPLTFTSAEPKTQTQTQRQPAALTLTEVIDRPHERPQRMLEEDPLPKPVEKAPVNRIEPALPQPDVFELAAGAQSRRITVEASEDPWFVVPLAHLKAFSGYLGKAVADGVLTAGAFGLFFVMLAHILSVGAGAGYEQGPFIVLAALLSAWFQRRRLNKGKRSFWLGLIASVAGLGIFFYGTVKGFVYLEIAGFILTCAGIFCARHTKQSANGLLFPLLCLAFAIAPPAFLADKFVPQLNTWIAQGSAFVLQFLHIPSDWTNGVFNAGGYQFFLNKDTTDFRFLVAALPLALLYAHLRWPRGFRKWIVMAAVVPLAMIAAIVHTAGTGWVAYTYGNPYADGFYGLAGIILFFVLGLFALADSLRGDDDHF